MYQLRGSLLLAAVHDRTGFFGHITRSLELPVELVKLDAALGLAGYGALIREQAVEPIMLPESDERASCPIPHTTP